MDDGRYGPGCERHKGDPHNLCEVCWALEPESETQDEGPGWGRLIDALEKPARTVAMGWNDE